MKSQHIKVLFLASIIICTLSNPVFAQSTPHKVDESQQDWKLLIKANNAYEAGDFGNAIDYAQQAKESRQNNCIWEVYTLEQAEKSLAVKKAKDNLNLIIPILNEHKMYDAETIIQDLLKKYGSERFDNKLTNCVEFIRGNDKYPEADYLIGKIYRLEGENEIALDYMKKAYSNSSYLNVPDVKYDILYDLANLSVDMGREADQEQYLLLVLSDNSYYKDDNFMNALLRIIGEDSSDAVDKFFLLYRSNADFSILALSDLAQFYDENNQGDKALRCAALDSIIAVTKMTTTLEERISDYRYKDIKDLLTKAAKYDDIVEWGDENNVWETLYNFATYCTQSGKIVFGRKLYSILAEYEPDEYWRKRSKAEIDF